MQYSIISTGVNNFDNDEIVDDIIDEIQDYVHNGADDISDAIREKLIYNQHIFRIAISSEVYEYDENIGKIICDYIHNNDFDIVFSGFYDDQISLIDNIPALSLEVDLIEDLKLIVFSYLEDTLRK